MVYPGQVRSSLHDHEKERMPDWYDLDGAAPAEPLGEGDRRGRREGQARGLLPVQRAPPADRARAVGPRWPTPCCAASCIGAPPREACPCSPPLKPQLAKSSRDLPDGDGWCYEPKWDGFRTIVFRDGDEVHLQSRNGKPMNRYFPDIVEQALALKASALRARRRDRRDRRRHPGVRPARRSASTRRPRAWSASPGDARDAASPSTCWPRATTR